MRRKRNMDTHKHPSQGKFIKDPAFMMLVALRPGGSFPLACLTSTAFAPRGRTRLRPACQRVLCPALLADALPTNPSATEVSPQLLDCGLERNM